VEQVALVGSPTECTDKLQAMINAGVRGFCFILQPGTEEEIFTAFSTKIRPGLQE
jgi:alkanesulfonate monooxygenase SsuD/methylene tetrahydromethanopterin reductase-like flavin-dependent oxidoreductase (luciferase family)